jgi:DNA topoisomerase-2
MAKNAKMPLDVSQRYKKLDDIEHCLTRPGMYIGSTKTQNSEVYLLDDDTGKFELCSVSHNPGFLKLFDEIVSNSADEHRRNSRLNSVEVTADAATGRITVRDNGGIPVVKHTEHDEWIPEMIFSNLKAGSNFDDTEDRLVAGTNGVGSTLTNIFSREFSVQTCDGKREFRQVFRNNMRDREEPVVKTRKLSGYTEISYLPDFAQFELEGLDADHIQMMRKRCSDLAACNPSLTVHFNGEKFSYPSFSAYCRLYVPDVLFEASERWRIGVGVSSGSMQQVSFVNGVETKDGGTHVDFVASQVVDAVRERLRKKHKVDLRPAEIRNHLFVFVSADIVNSSFSSQTKEKLITDPRDFGSKHELSDKFLKSVVSSEVVQRVLDWAQQKKKADEKKALRDLNKKLDKEKVLKLIDAKGRNRSDCTLSLFEGDSASSAFRKYRDPMTQGAFPLRGKFLNVSGMPASKVVQNKEVQALLNAIGLRLGEDPEDLRYGKVLIYSDADPDGDSIAGLLTNFFGRYWPEMLEKKMLYRVMTPLVVATRKAERKMFYTVEDFERWQASSESKGWDVSYKKGLAALEDPEYCDIIRDPRMFALVPGDDLEQSLEDWFGDDPTPRKEKILKG